MSLTAEAASSVTLAWDPSSSAGISGYRLYQGVASRTYTNSINAGSATNATINGLATGVTYYFAVTAYDSNNLESSYSAEVSYTPSAVVAPAITLSSPVNNSKYTAPANIALAALVTANGHTINKVQFFNGSTLLGESLAAPYSYTANNLGAGTYSISATAIYDTTNSLRSTVATVNVTNTIAPAIALTSPSNNSSYTAPANITMAASVTANGHTINKVQFFNGSTLLGESPAAPYSYTANNLGAGTYSISATAVYDTTNSLRSTIAAVNVTNTLAPAIALTSPANNSSYTAPANIALAASVTANGHTINKVQFFNGSTLLGESLAAPYSYTANNLGAGTYSISATAIYDTTNSLRSTIAAVNVTNTLAPAIALTSPANNSSYTAPANIALAASVTANGHTINKVQFFNGSTLLGESLAAPYSYTANLGAGTYSINATAIYDTTNSLRSTIAAVNVTNTLAPAIALTSPSNNSSYTAPANITMAASVTANGHTINKVQFFNGSTLLGESLAAPYSCVASNLAAGAYSVNATAVYDSTNSLGCAVANVTVTNNLPAPWQTADIGGPIVSGSASVANGIYTVSGAGALGGAADQFRFLYQPMSGKGEIRAQISGEQNIGPAPIAGIMMRESLTPGSEFVFIGFQPDGKLGCMYRKTTSISSSTVAAGTGVMPNVWVRLVRSAGTFSAYTSTDGKSWKLVTSPRISMASATYFGFVAVSGSSSVLNSATFGSATITP